VEKRAQLIAYSNSFKMASFEEWIKADSDLDPSLDCELPGEQYSSVDLSSYKLVYLNCHLGQVPRVDDIAFNIHWDHKKIKIIPGERNEHPHQST
jgi:hypothetical protein